MAVGLPPGIQRAPVKCDGVASRSGADGQQKGRGAGGGRRRRCIRFTGLFLASSWLRAAAGIAVNVPFQVVRPSDNHTSMLLTEGINALGLHDEEQIAVVSVVGPYHSGKSFLLNALLGKTGIFPIGRKTSPETMGIWLCRTELRASDGSEVWLLDSEGFFGPSVTESYDAKVFTIATLLGAHLVYNTVKVIDQQAVSLLEMLARRAQLFRKNTSVELARVETPDFLSVDNFPLTWVVEDFVQELPEQYRFEGGATSWLKSYMESVNVSGDDEVHVLSHLYSELSVQTLFLPAVKREQLQDLSRVDWDDLTTEFREELAQLREHILGNLRARSFEGLPMTGRSLKRAINFVVHALQRGKFHELPSLWSTWAAQVAEISLQDAERWFVALLADIDHDDTPIPMRNFNTKADDARVRSVKFYQELLEDFLIVRESDVNQLHNRMDVHAQHKVVLYHERILRWVHELMAKEKDEVAKRFSLLDSPMDPDILGPMCENITGKVIERFSVMLRDFASQGPRSEGPHRQRPAANMPAFAQDPEAHLTKELRNLVSVQEHENERAIEDIFKAARDAADEAVASEIDLNSNKMVGKARMFELQELAASRCQQAFDGKLMKFNWTLNLSHYRLHQALVQRDALQSRMDRFRSQNSQKISTHFQAALARSEGLYQQRKANVVIEPMSEEDVDKKHQQVANSIRSALDEQGKGLTDTDAYQDALRRLNQILDEGHKHIRQKNVELWKVHSDEATRCAMRRNKAFKQRCNLVCLFNKVPKVHKERSRWHLVDCLETSGVSARMGQRMAHQVFEDWYNKELAHDAADVWNNFYMASAVVGLGVLWLCTVCRPFTGEPVAAPYYYNTGPPRIDGYADQGGYGSRGYGSLFGPNYVRR